MDTVDPLRFIFSFLFVIGLIGVMGFCLKRYGQRLFGRKFFPAGEEGGRVQVLEVRWLDTKRKLALIRRDKVEHLLLLSDKGEQVIESVRPGDDTMNDDKMKRE